MAAVKVRVPSPDFVNEAGPLVHCLITPLITTLLLTVILRLPESVWEPVMVSRPGLLLSPKATSPV